MNPVHEFLVYLEMGVFSIAIFALIFLHAKALEHSSKAVELGLGEHTANAEAFHIHGGILKDLGRLNEAEEVK